MKFTYLALIAIVAAEEEADSEEYTKVEANGECDASVEKKGCVDGHQCGSKTGEGKGTCVPEDKCGTGEGDDVIECSAKALAASAAALFAIASAM